MSEKHDFEVCTNTGVCSTSPKITFKGDEVKLMDKKFLPHIQMHFPDGKPIRVMERPPSLKGDIPSTLEYGDFIVLGAFFVGVAIFFLALYWTFYGITTPPTNTTSNLFFFLFIIVSIYLFI